MVGDRVHVLSGDLLFFPAAELIRRIVAGVAARFGAADPGVRSIRADHRAAQALRRWSCFIVVVVASTVASVVGAQSLPLNYQLAAGDQIRVTVFQSPDLSLETRVSEDGTISYPLIGKMAIGNLDIAVAERKIATALKSGGFLKDPQVNIQVTDIRGNTVSVLGQVNRAGIFPLVTTMHLSQVLAAAGGITSTGSDHVLLTGTRNGAPFRQELDITALYQENSTDPDPVLAAGDSVFVPRAPTFYIYGEVFKPGNYKLERGMTMRQAIAAGGGLTLRGTERRLKVVRATAQGTSAKMSTELDDPVQAGDVVYVSESYF